MSNSNFQYPDSSHDSDNADQPTATSLELDQLHLFVPAGTTKDKVLNAIDQIKRMAKAVDFDSVKDRDFAILGDGDSIEIGTNYRVGNDLYRLDNHYEVDGQSYTLPSESNYLVLSWAGSTHPEMFVDKSDGSVYETEPTQSGIGVKPNLDKRLCHISQYYTKAEYDRIQAEAAEPDLPFNADDYNTEQAIELGLKPEDSPAYQTMKQRESESIQWEAIHDEDEFMTAAQERVDRLEAFKERIEEQLKEAREDAVIEQAGRIIARRRAEAATQSLLRYPRRRNKPWIDEVPNSDDPTSLNYSPF